MRLISLNIWGGHIRAPLLEFIKSHRETDIFCLQEVYKKAPYKFSTDDKEASLDIFSDIQKLLPEHNGFFRPVIQDWYGIGLFITKEINVITEGYITIHENLSYPGRGPTHSRILQWIHCRHNEKSFAILNVHGLWNGQGKTDAPERIEQSKIIREFMDRLEMPIILCGDFNLRPETESMRILNQNMTNLIQTHNITSTRTNLYLREEKFADYILISSGITPKSFEVFQDEVSDHAPLSLDFDLL